MPITAGDIMDDAAVLINDPTKITYTYAKQLPYLRLAYQEIQDRLILLGHPTVNTQTEISVPAGTSQITLVGPNAARDVLLEAVMVYQRDVGADDNSWGDPIDRHPWLPVGEPNTDIFGWVWQEGIIILTPATANKEILVRYRTRLAVITNEASEIKFPGFRVFLAQKTAGYISEFVMKDRTRAAALYTLSERSFDVAVGTAVKSMQWMPAKRRSYFFRR